MHVCGPFASFRRQESNWQDALFNRIRKALKHKSFCSNQVYGYAVSNLTDILYAWARLMSFTEQAQQLATTRHLIHERIWNCVALWPVYACFCRLADECQSSRLAGLALVSATNPEPGQVLSCDANVVTMQVPAWSADQPTMKPYSIRSAYAKPSLISSTATVQNTRGQPVLITEHR